MANETSAAATKKEELEPVRPLRSGETVVKHNGLKAGDAVDKDVVSPVTGHKGDPLAGTVGIVGKDEKLDGSAAKVADPTDVQLPAKGDYTTALAMTFIRKDGTPMAADKGAKIPRDMVTDNDALHFIRLGYFKS